MRVIVNDISCLIDLRKAGWLHTALMLPFAFHIALPLCHADLLGFTTAEIEDLVQRGLFIIDLPGEVMRHAFDLRVLYPSLSFNDCVSLAFALTEQGSTLLTSDQSLALQAKDLNIAVQNILWVGDHLEANGLVAFAALYEGLQRLKKDPVVFLPKEELASRLAKFRKLLGLPETA